MGHPKMDEQRQMEILNVIWKHPDLTYQRIAKLVRCSESTVQRIAREAGIKRRGKDANNVPRNAEYEEALYMRKFRKHIEAWLKKNWRWEIPEKKKTIPEVRQRSFWKQPDVPGQHSEFRTPYNYPRKWKKDEDRQYLY